MQSKPLVYAQLLIRGNLRLRDIEEIMIRLRDEFGITQYALQIDNHSFDSYQEITLERVNLIRPRDNKGRFVKKDEIIAES